MTRGIAGRFFLASAIAVLAGAAGCTAPEPSGDPRPAPPPGTPDPEAPNLLLIMTDDQRTDMMEVVPAVRRNFTVEFPLAVATTPLCCPSRSSVLTGRYAHNTRVHTNADYERFRVLEPDSLASWLRAAGYRTGFVGKYFNLYGVDDPVPPGWDEFHALVWDEDGERIGNSTTEFALRERWSEEGTIRNEIVLYPNDDHPRPYMTRRFASLAGRFIRRAEDPAHNPRGRPWALLVWTNAPSATPEGKYRDVEVSWPPSPSYPEGDLSDKPAEVRFHPSRGPDAPGRLRARDVRSLMSVDDLVARIFRTIDELGLRKETWGLFTSDHGALRGEHGLDTKLFGYEESIRIPFLMAVPGRGRARVPELVATIDIAPTLVELAVDRSGHRFDGRSLVRLALGREERRWRRAVLIESWGDLGGRVRYEGLRTLGWKYIVWPDSGHVELYDLASDPYELENLAGRRPGVEKRLDRLRRELRL